MNIKFMRILCFAIIVSLGCKGTITNVSVKQIQKDEIQYFMGAWSNEFDAPENELLNSSFELYLVENHSGESPIMGWYCSITRGGDRTDCSSDKEEYNLQGYFEDGVIYINFTSFNNPQWGGEGKVYKSHDESIIWELVNATGELFVPKRIALKRDLNAREILQKASTQNHYFRVVLHNNNRITGVKIYDKKTGKLIQEIAGLDCQNRGFDNISIGDFNFDGEEDFAVFEEQFAGPNTGSLYFLYDSKTKQYFNSGFVGVSLTFDNMKKRIYSINSSSGGSVVTRSIYTVEDNKMILLEQECYIWNEKQQKLIQRDMGECK